MANHIGTKLIPVIKDSYENGKSSPNNVKRIFILQDVVVIEYHIPIVINGTKRKFNKKSVLDLDMKQSEVGLKGLIKPLVCSMIEEVIIDVKHLQTLDFWTADTNFIMYTIVNELLSNNSVTWKGRFPRLRNIMIVTDVEIDNLLSDIIANVQNIDYSVVDTNNFKVLVNKDLNNKDWFIGSYYRPLNYQFDNKLRKYFDDMELTYRSELSNKLSLDVDKSFKDGAEIIDKGILLEFSKFFKVVMESNTSDLRKTVEYFKSSGMLIYICPVEFIESDTRLTKPFTKLKDCGLGANYLKDSLSNQVYLNNLLKIHNDFVDYLLNLDDEFECIDPDSDEELIEQDDNDLNSEEDEDFDGTFDFTSQDDDEDNELEDNNKLELDFLNAVNKDKNELLGDKIEDMVHRDTLSTKSSNKGNDGNGNVSNLDFIGNVKDLSEVELNLNPSGVDDTNVGDELDLNDMQEGKEQQIIDYLESFNTLLGIAENNKDFFILESIDMDKFKDIKLDLRYIKKVSGGITLDNLVKENIVNLQGILDRKVVVESQLSLNTIIQLTLVIKEFARVLNANRRFNVKILEDFIESIKLLGYSEIKGNELRKFSRAFKANGASRADDKLIYGLKQYIDTKYIREVRQNNNLIYCNDDYNSNSEFDRYSFKAFSKNQGSYDTFYICLPNTAGNYIGAMGFLENLLLSYKDLAGSTSPYLSVYSVETESGIPDTVLKVVYTKEEFDTKVMTIEDLAKGQDKSILSLMGGAYKFGDESNIVLGFTPQRMYTLNGTKLSNRSLLYGGGTGSGKTVGIWGILFQLIAQGSPIIAIDVKGEITAQINDLGYLGFSDKNPLDTDLSYLDAKTNTVKQSGAFRPWALGTELQMCIYEYYKAKLEKSRCKDYKSYNAMGGDEIRPLIYIVDEMESLLADAKKPNDVAVSNIKKIASQSRTAGIWRLYGTQTPKTSTLDQSLLTNITYKLIGKNLKANVVQSSLYLEFSEDMYKRILGGSDTDSEVANKVNGLFAAYKDGGSPKLIKTLLAPQENNEIKAMIKTYCMSGYQSGVTYLNNLLLEMQKNNAFKKYPHVELYLKQVGKLPEVVKPDDMDIDSDIQDLVDNESMDLEINDDEPIDIDEDFDYAYNDNGVYDDMGATVNNTDKFGEKQKPIVEAVKDRLEPSIEPNVNNNKSKNIVDMAEDDTFLNGAKEVKREPINEEPYIITRDLYKNTKLSWAKHNGFTGKFRQAAGYNNRFVYSELTNLLLSTLKATFGSLNSVNSLRFESGYLIVNGRLLKCNINFDKAQIESPVITDIIKNNLWGDAFDYKQLKKFKNLYELALNSRYNYQKLRADTKINNGRDLKRLVPSLEKFIVCGVVQDLTQSDKVGVPESEKIYNKKCKEYEKASAYGFKPEKYTLLENMYKKDGISKTVKVVSTVGVLGVAGLLGSLFGPVLLPLVIGKTLYDRTRS